MDTAFIHFYEDHYDIVLTSSPSGCPLSQGRIFRCWTRATTLWRTCGPSGRITPCWALPLRQTLCLRAERRDVPGCLPRALRTPTCPDVIPCDARNAEEIGSLLPQSGFVMLCGGHVPEPLFAAGPAGAVPQLPRHRAGRECRSMNAAHIVYAAREDRAKPPTRTTPAG